ncbi:hypothetical protein B7Y94_03885 [Candidatus Saccharibacteria bacterium 32-49-12]|nr:MAG: hypothetical protein B7Y94_03885 [Candidatus Saccharibacteria bacterium 32-49-12]
MKIVVVGGGFGGIKVAIELARRKVGKITLISDREYFTHHALLYSVASGRDPGATQIPIKEMIKDYPAITFSKDSITSIDPIDKLASGQMKKYRYDQLILSIGLVNHFYGVNGAKKHSYALSSLEDVGSLSRDFHERLVEGGRDVVCAVVGGGVSGVEFAASLSEYADRISESHGKSSAGAKIILLEKSNRILSGLSNQAERKVSTRLKGMGVEIMLDRNMEKVTKTSIVANGKSTPVDMSIWACGGQPHPFFMKHNEQFHLSKRGRVVVNQYLSAYPNVYVIGDNAEVPGSGTASSAMHQAKFLALHLDRAKTGRPQPAYKPGPRATISIPLSRFWAYSERFGVYASGLTGSLCRRIVELDSYFRLMPAGNAWRFWRMHRKNKELCTICQ